MTVRKPGPFMALVGQLERVLAASDRASADSSAEWLLVRLGDTRHVASFALDYARLVPPFGWVCWPERHFTPAREYDGTGKCPRWHRGCSGPMQAVVLLGEEVTYDIYDAFKKRDMGGGDGPPPPPRGETA